MQRQIGMVEHQQQQFAVGPGFRHPFRERQVARAPAEQLVEPGPQPGAFRFGWRRPIGNQLAIEGPVVRPEGGQHVAMDRDDGGQFGIMASIVDPAERVFVGQQVIDGRVVAQQASHDRHGRLGVIGRNRQGIPDLLALLGTERHPGTVQMAGQIRGAQIGVPGQRGTQLSEQRPANAGSIQPSQGVGIQAEEGFLAPQHRQHILARAARTGLIDREEGIAEHMAGFILPVDARTGLVGRLPIATSQPGLVDRLSLCAPAGAVVAQPAGDRALADRDPGILKEGQQAGLADIRPVAESQGQGLDMRAKLAMVAIRQRCSDRRSSAGKIPDLASKADDLGLQDQILDDDLGRVVADGIRRQGGAVHHTAFSTGGHQDAQFSPFLAGFRCMALALGGMIVGWRRWSGRFDIRFPRAALQPR